MLWQMVPCTGVLASGQDEQEAPGPWGTLVGRMPALGKCGPKAEGRPSLAEGTSGLGVRAHAVLRRGSWEGEGVLPRVLVTCCFQSRSSACPVDGRYPRLLLLRFSFRRLSKPSASLILRVRPMLFNGVPVALAPAHPPTPPTPAPCSRGRPSSRECGLASPPFQPRTGCSLCLARPSRC